MLVTLTPGAWHAPKYLVMPSSSNNLLAALLRPVLSVKCFHNVLGICVQADELSLLPSHVDGPRASAGSKRRKQCSRVVVQVGQQTLMMVERILLFQSTFHSMGCHTLTCTCLMLCLS